jgi:hypothetical protein
LKCLLEFLNAQEDPRRAFEDDESTGFGFVNELNECPLFAFITKKLFCENFQVYLLKPAHNEDIDGPSLR